MKHPNTFVSIIVQGIVSAIMAFVLIVFGSIAYGQQIYSGPAFGQISGGSQVSTTQFKKPPKGPDSWKLINAHWERHPLELVDDMYNKTPAAAPLHSNEFLDSGVISNPKQEVIPPAVVIDHQGNPQSNSIPPDPIMAAGPNHIITMVNSSFIIWDKRGNMLFQIQADTWFSNVLPYNGLFDPVIIYDHFDQRWVMLWDLQDDNDQSGYWVISVSDDADPMGTWCNYLFAAHLNGSVNSFTWGDYPKMGYDHQAIYVTGRQFSFSGFFQYSKLRIIPKSQLYDAGCGPVDYTDFWNFRDPNTPGQRVDGP
ncbi:MAG: hypothetical protein ACE5GL_11790, partial [Calditrichia bacterium]